MATRGLDLAFGRLHCGRFGDCVGERVKELETPWTEDKQTQIEFFEYKVFFAIDYGLLIMFVLKFYQALFIFFKKKIFISLVFVCFLYLGRRET